MLIGLVSLPVIAPLALALWQEWGWLALLFSPVALGYGGLLFWFSLRFASQRAVEREPEILLATKPKDKGNK